MILAAHQPDLLPYTGFWYKMARADVFDLSIFDQLQHPGYQNRVKMAGSWCTLPVGRSEHRKPIVDVEIDELEWVRILIDTVKGRYCHARLYKQMMPWVVEAIRKAGRDAESGLLWQFNLSLILSVRDRLAAGSPRLATPIAIGSRPRGDTVTDRLLDVIVRQYRAQRYVSGAGGMAYLDRQLADQAGVVVESAEHQPYSPDSILTLLFEQEDPVRFVVMSR